MVDATKRFTDRVDNYRLYRPGYPAALVEFLRLNCELRPAAQIADIGAGTGLLSRVFLDAGFRVVGIEPNHAMREAGEPGAIDATAEATTLPDKSVDLIVAGQAFHWFDPPRTRTEWLRILRPPAYVALIWNERFDESPFMRELGAMIDRYAAARDRDGAIRKAGKDRIPGFFAPQPYRVDEFPNQQTFGFDALLGRVVSSSYLPNEGDPDYAPLVRELREISDRWQQAGTVEFEYRTRVYWGRLGP